MPSAYVRPDYDNLDRPFIIMGRNHDLGGTDYWTIARVSEDDALVLVASGLRWWMGEPDWEEHHRRIEKLRLLRTVAAAEKRLAELKEQEKTK